MLYRGYNIAYNKCSILEKNCETMGEAFKGTNTP